MCILTLFIAGGVSSFERVLSSVNKTDDADDADDADEADMEDMMDDDFDLDRMLTEAAAKDPEIQASLKRLNTTVEAQVTELKVDRKVAIKADPEKLKKDKKLSECE